MSAFYILQLLQHLPFIASFAPLCSVLPHSLARLMFWFTSFYCQFPPTFLSLEFFSVLLFYSSSFFMHPRYFSLSYRRPFVPGVQTFLFIFPVDPTSISFLVTLSLSYLHSLLQKYSYFSSGRNVQARKSSEEVQIWLVW